jgi:hypothetical protein
MMCEQLILGEREWEVHVHIEEELERRSGWVPSRQNAGKNE